MLLWKTNYGSCFVVLRVKNHKKEKEIPRLRKRNTLKKKTKNKIFHLCFCEKLTLDLCAFEGKKKIVKKKRKKEWVRKRKQYKVINRQNKHWQTSLSSINEKKKQKRICDARNKLKKVKLLSKITEKKQKCTKNWKNTNMK